jgi:hypothetical protein
LAFTIKDLQSIALPNTDPSGVWRGRLTLTGSRPGESFEAIEELLLYFSRFAATGALALSLEHIGTSAFKFDVQRSGGRLAAEITARHVHPGAWRVLLQMISHCREMEPFETLELADHRGPPPASEESAILANYPPVFAHPDLADVSSSWGGEESPIIEVTCGRNLLKEELDSISTAVDDWGSLVYVGGFTAPSEKIDTPLLDKPRVVRQGWSAFDISIPYWMPNVDAAATLQNMLIALEMELSITAIGCQ